MIYALGEQRIAVIARHNIRDAQSAAFLVQIRTGQLCDLLFDLPGISRKASALVQALVCGSGIGLPVQRVNAQRLPSARDDQGFLDALRLRIKGDDHARIVLAPCHFQLGILRDILLRDPPTDTICGNQLVAVLGIVEIFLHQHQKQLRALRKSRKDDRSSVVAMLEIVFERRRHVTISDLEIGLHFLLRHGIYGERHLSVVGRVHNRGILINTALHIQRTDEAFLCRRVFHRHIIVFVLSHIYGGTDQKQIGFLPLPLCVIRPILDLRIIDRIGFSGASAKKH